MLFSGCSLFKKGTDIPGEKISADTPWYECEIIDCVADLGEKDLLLELNRYIIYCNKK